MRRSTSAVLGAMALGLLLGGCADDGSSDRGAGAGDEAVAVSGAFAVPLPDGWADRTQETAADLPEVDLVLQSEEADVRQVVGRSFDGAAAAEDAVVSTTAGVASSFGVPCERLDGDDPLDAPDVLVVCPFTEEDVPFVKVWVTFVDGDRSASLLLQAEGATLDEAAGALRPFVDGFDWRG